MLSRPVRRVLSTVVLAAILVASGAAPALAHNNTPTVPNPRLTGSIGAVAAAAELPAAVFTAPTAGHPQATSQTLSLTRNPAGNSAAAFTTPNDACVVGECVEQSVTIPAGSGQTLYARAAWTALTQYAHVWGISPSGTIVGRSTTANTVDKSVGGANVTPLAEFTVPNPEPGVWKVQFRAVFGVQIPVQATVALSKGRALEFPRLDVTQLADSSLTQRLTYNIVFVNRTWTSDEVKTFRAAMPTQYRQSVLAKQDAGGSGNETGLESTALNWGGEHYDGTSAPGATGNVPYFEPTRYGIDYRFLSADRGWTGDLFAAMAKATTKDVQFPTTPASGARRIKQGDYLSAYDGRSGKINRGPDYLVTNPTKGDAIDAFTVEDWVFDHRGDSKYAQAFTNVETGAHLSARFIDPDPGAYFDPYYTRTGKRNLDRMPQGADTSITFFVLDTFGGGTDNPADLYFRKNAYHFFDVSQHMFDPDTHEPGAGPNDSRVWGGRYRFFLHDLGAGPNILETQDGFTANTPTGSADKPNGDPPIWDYTNDAQWAGQLVPNTARDAKAMLFSRLIGNYLYRPIPADVFFLASNNWVDCYSNPQCSPDGVSYTDLTKVFNADYIEKNLGAAVPGVTFTTERGKPGLQTYRYLGCAAKRAVVNPDPDGPVGAAGTGSSTPYVLAPDPNCVGKKSDKFQEALEYAKSRGDTIAGGVNDATVNTQTFRAFVETDRPEIAPQPAGQFTLTNISVVFPGAMTWALPAIVGGIALGTPNNEGWGILNNLNDRFKGTNATDCAKSKAFAPGCNNVPSLGGGGGFSYTIEHEASHFLGLLHPHDYQTVDQDAKGNWTYYGTAGSHYPDFSMAPTTYLGDFAPYSVLDQDIINRGHTAEYLSRVQDYLADAYTTDGIAGQTSPSALTQRKLAESARWKNMGSSLFGCGDYLHAERAMRNASLAAAGTFGPVVPPRQLLAGEKVLLAVDPQPVFGPDGQSLPGCRSGASTTPTGLATMAAVERISAQSALKPTAVATLSLPTTGMGALPALIAGALMLTALGVRRRVRG